MRLPQNVSGLPQFSDEVAGFEVWWVRQFLPRDGTEKWVAEPEQVCFKCSGPLPAKGVLHKGAQLTNGVKFNEGN